MPSLVSRSTPDLGHPKASLLHIVGLRNDTPDQESRLYRLRLMIVAAGWPFAAAMQILAGMLLNGATLVRGVPTTLGIQAAMATMLLAVPTLAVWALLAWPRPRQWPLPLRTRALAIASGGIAAALSVLVWIATRLPADGVQIGCFVAIAGAAGVTTVVLSPVRATTAAFYLGGCATLPFLSGALLVCGSGLVILGCIAGITVRLARLDASIEHAQAAEASEGKLAAKMIAEFEKHGTGWFWETDRHGRLTYLSAKVASELAAHTLHAGGAIGRPLTDLFRMDSAAPGTERTLAFHLSSRTSFSDYTICAAGRTVEDEPDRWWSISGRPIVDDLGRFQGFIGSGSDLTEKRRSDAEITRLALFDSLTGLANRQRMRHSLDKTLQQQGGPYRPASLFLMDLDRFKAVNDTLGHQAGDALLKQVAQRLERIVGGHGLVGRLGGDEFQVLLPGTNDREALADLARQLIRGLSQPYFIADTSVTIGCSIGIAIAPEHGEDAEELIRNADLALYAAKADGRGVHRFYSDDMLAGAKSRQALEDDMRAALGGGGFILAYQPVVSTRDAHIVGYEALLRWHHPVRGAVSPAEFVPVAEECGLIEALGEWVLRTACAEAARWPGGVRVAVNVSPIQFANPNFPALVTSALAHSGLPAGRLELEITEGVFLDESGSTDAMFKSLKALGVRLALDDFGTGYSSLGYLRTAPFDKIKIDQSFVRGAAQPGNRNAAIIRAIVTLAETLGMETTAEGVEIQDEIELVRLLGCSHIQGYVYGRGVSAADVMAQLGGSTHAAPTGHKVSRAPRNRMLRSAKIAIGAHQGDVRIRNISTSGAMIDGIDINGQAVGVEVLIELVEDQMVAARIAWAEDGKAGLAFDDPVNLDRLSAMPFSRIRQA